ncbi:hypothetical protein PHLCEN_2v10865, partial [Hermanssonia centrifuga]
FQTSRCSHLYLRMSPWSMRKNLHGRSARIGWFSSIPEKDRRTVVTVLTRESRSKSLFPRNTCPLFARAIHSCQGLRPNARDLTKFVVWLCSSS